jgi:hypothetical protein
VHTRAKRWADFMRLRYRHLLLLRIIDARLLLRLTTVLLFFHKCFVQ